MIIIKRIPTIIVATLVVAAMTIVSCSNDETVSQQPTATDMPIGFNVIVDKNTTTRNVATTTTAGFSEFDVWAFRASESADYVANGNYVMGVDATRGFLFQKNSSIGVVNDSIKALGVWGYANKSQITFWPHDGTQYMSFYAVSPSSINGTVPHRTMNVINTAPAFAYEAYEATNGSHADQRDLLIAGSKVKLTTINKMGVEGQPWMSVPLTFKHALSQIKFDAHLETGFPELKVIIESITICNVARTGICTIGTDNTASWATTGSKTLSYTVKTPGTNGNGITLYTKNGVNYDGTTTGVTTPIALSTGNTEGVNDDNLMLIPQQITAWNPTNTIALNDAIATPGSYLKIKCAITQNGINLLTENYVYVPFAGTISSSTDAWNSKWEAGKSYTYHLQFGLGYNSQGISYGSGITYTVSVNDTWTTPVESSIPL